MDIVTKSEGFTKLIFENDLVLDTVFSHLPVSSLRHCRLVNSVWNISATSAIRKSLKTRLLLCADAKCTTDLKKFIEVYSQGSTIPYARALLILDHLPRQGQPKCEVEHQSGEMELMHQMTNLFSDHFDRRQSDTYIPMFQEDGHAVKAACDLFSTSIHNLIVNLTLHQETPENMEYWLRNVTFSNLNELNFHITRASPETLSIPSLVSMFNSVPNLKSFGLRKLTKKGDRLMNDIITGFVKKSNLNKLRQLSLELFTDNKDHLESLIHSPLCVVRLSLIYLGGEVRFTDKLDLIKQLLSTISRTLQHLYTHLPLFSRDQRNIPKLPYLRTLQVEKVYREFSVSQSHIFDFDFSYYFPSLQKISFKDYDIWKNMMLKTFPLNEVMPCTDIFEVVLPDLCFDVSLMERYLMKFPNLRTLSLIVSYVSRYQKQCSYCLVYRLLPHLQELNIKIFEVDIPMYNQLFTGMTDEKCKQLLLENRDANQSDRELSIANLKDLKILRISSLNGNRDLGISDLSVTFGFLQLPSLTHLFIDTSRITPEAIAKMAEKFDVTIWRKSACSTPTSTDKIGVNDSSNA